MEYVKIGGKIWNVTITGMSESFNILYSENTGRTLSPTAKMILDPIGTFYGHKITVTRKKGNEEEFDELFDFISKPRYDGVPVELVHGQKTIAYNAYISNGERKLKKIDLSNNKVYWDELSINIIPTEAQVTP